MEEFQINPYVFFGALEMAMLFLVVALAFFIRSKVLGGKIAELQLALKKAEDVEPPEPVLYEQYLRDEVLRNEAFIDQAAASEDDEEKKDPLDFDFDFDFFLVLDFPYFTYRQKGKNLYFI